MTLAQSQWREEWTVEILTQALPTLQPPRFR
jgi:hypothetical protein